MKISLAASLLVSLFFSTLALANTRVDPHLPISHCYHWLNEGANRYLTHKYTHAARNEGELTFYTTGGNGAVAGPGLYCGKTPIDSYGYGDRVIRIDFVEDVVLYDSLSNRQYCGHRGDFYTSSAECQSKPWDVKFYNGGGIGNMAWYVIRSPQSILRWSPVGQQLISDLIANKPSDYSYSVHADNTIRLMQADPMFTKMEVFENHNARLSIIKILNDPSKLAQVPPLTIISHVRIYSGKELNKAKKIKIYEEQFDRAFTDTMLSQNDFLAAIRDSKDVEAVYLERLKAIDLDQLDKVNPVVVLQGLDRFARPEDLSSQIVRKLWRAALLSTSDLQSLVEAPLKADGEFAKGFESSLPTISEFGTKLKPGNLGAVISILNTYVNDGTGPNTKAVVNGVLKELLTREGEAFISVYDNITNDKLQKGISLANSIQELTPATLKLIDPLTLGLAVDRSRASLDSATISVLEQKILDLPLKVTDRPSYQLLESFQHNNLAVPTFYPEVLLIKRILERSISERAVLKTASNTFRMTVSGLFYFFNAKVKAVSGGAKKVAASQAGAKGLLELAASMQSVELTPYRYAVLQNASYFLGNGRYENHPLDAIYAQYGKGDATLDALIEEVLVKAYDGTVLQFLATSATDPNALRLLSLVADQALSADFQQELSDNSFLESQSEKKAWDNIIKAGRYSKSDRVPADVCHMANVSLRSMSELSKHLTPTQVIGLKQWADDLKDGLCK